MRLHLLTTALLTALFSTSALAHDESPCTQEPENKWQPLSAALRKAEQAGHTVKNAEVHHKCYEIRGRTRDGKRFEMILNPVTLEARKPAQ